MHASVVRYIAILCTCHTMLEENASLQTENNHLADELYKFKVLKVSLKL